MREKEKEIRKECEEERNRQVRISKIRLRFGCVFIEMIPEYYDFITSILEVILIGVLEFSENMSYFFE